MITLQKHEISANIKNRYANVSYCFHFNNRNENGSDELMLEMTVDPNSFISNFTADIDGELFIGETKEKQTASKEYVSAKQKNENAILIDQPHKDIHNLFRIKTNIDAQSNVILTVEIQQYLQKTFNFNELNIQILRSFSKYNITENFDHIAFDLTVEDVSGIYNVHIPMINNTDVIIEEQKMDKLNRKCVITGKITSKSVTESDIDTEDVEWRNTIKVNDKIDVNDRGKWYMSEVIERTDGNMCEKLKIHYVGFSNKYDEEIEINSDRLAKYKFNSKTTNTKTNELKLKYKVKGEANHSHILFDNKSNTFCHIISDTITDSMIIDQNEGQNNVLIPRRVLFVIDKSGSMGGHKWIKTISSSILAIKQLRIGYDRFGIILFNHDIKMLSCKDGCTLANDQSINDCVKALKDECADGGTDINSALYWAIELIKTDIVILNKLINNKNIDYNFFINQIIFITDGEPQNGVTNTNNILLNVKNTNDLSTMDKYNDKINIFSFGIGKDSNDNEWTSGLNHSFLKLLSLNNNGFYNRIKQHSADAELAQYFGILSKPILSNINIEYKNKNVTDLTNTKFNTLYSGNDLIVCGKIKTKQDLTVIVSAVTGKEMKQNGTLIVKPIDIKKTLTIEINYEMNGSNGKNLNTTERIWAYLKLKQFAIQKLIYNDMIEIDDDEKKQDESLALSLAVKYNFISPWSSMIVVKKKQTEQKNNVVDESYPASPVPPSKPKKEEIVSNSNDTLLNLESLDKKHTSNRRSLQLRMRNLPSLKCAMILGVDEEINNVNENNNNTNDYAAPIANAAPMRFGAKKQLKQKQYRVVYLQQDLFVMTVEAVYKELEEQKIWKIDENVRKQFDAETMYRAVLKHDIAWKKWQWFVREQITNYLRENNMVISESEVASNDTKIRDDEKQTNDEMTVFLNYYKLQKYNEYLRDAGIGCLNDLKSLNNDDTLILATKLQMKTLHSKKFISACKDLKSGKYPPKHVNESNKVDQWLERYNLKKYSHALKKSGLNRLNDINQLNENEIVALAVECRMDVLHTKKFIHACQEYKVDSKLINISKYKKNKNKSIFIECLLQ